MVPVALLGFAAYLRVEERAFRANARPARATLVDYKRSDDRDRRGRDMSRIFEVYEYQTHAGQVARFTAPIERRLAPNPIGTTVDIWYPPAEPSRARIAEPSGEGAATVLIYCAPLGLVFAIPFFVLWRRTARA